VNLFEFEDYVRASGKVLHRPLRHLSLLGSLNHETSNLLYRNVRKNLQLCEQTQFAVWYVAVSIVLAMPQPRVAQKVDPVHV
jgi:hypothetical protein